MAHLSPAQNARLRRRMLAYRAEHCGDNTTTLAGRLGLKQPSLSKFFAGGGSAYATALRFARLVAEDVDDVIGPIEEQTGEGLGLSATRAIPGGDARSDSATMDAVRAMARAEGFDEEFVVTWQPSLEADAQPRAGHLWMLMQADWASARQKRIQAASADTVDRLEASIDANLKDDSDEVKRVRRRSPPLPSPQKSGRKGRSRTAS